MTDKLSQLMKEIKNLSKRMLQQEQRLALLEKRLGLPAYHASEIAPVKRKSSKHKPFNWQKVELFFGNYALQIIGIVVFLLGMGFLLKYAIEKELFTSLLHITLGLRIATSLLATTFLAFVAFWYSSLFLSIVSLLGGFITPVFLSITDGDPIVLAGYLLLLTFGYSVLAYIKKWYVLSILSFVFLSWYYALILTNQLTPLYCILFLMSIWLFYTLLPILHIVITKTKKGFYASTSIVISTVVVFLASYRKIITHRDSFAATFPFLSPLFTASSSDIFKYLSFGLSGLLFLLLCIITILYKKNRDVMGTLVFLIVSFISVGLILQWCGECRSATLVLFGGLLFILGLQLHEKCLRWWAYLLWIVSFIILGTQKALTLNYMVTHKIWNGVNLAVILMGSTFFIVSYCAAYYKKALSKEEKNVADWTLIAVLVVLVYWFYTPVLPFPFTIIGLCLTSLGAFFIGLHWNKWLVRTSSYWIAGLAIIRFVFIYYMLNLLNPYYLLSLNALFIGFVVMFVGMSLLNSWYKKRLTSHEQCWFSEIVSFLITFFVFWWGVANIILQFDYLHGQGSIFIKRLIGYSMKHDSLVRTQGTEVLLTIYYIFYSLICIIVGLFRNKYLLRYFGFLLIFFALIKLSFIILAMNSMLYRIIAFIITGLLLIIGSFMYQRVSKREVKRKRRKKR